MSVHGCGRGCGRQIYESMIPGGGPPVSLPNASKYTAAALYCRRCREYTCVSCAARPPGLGPMHDCPSCGTPLSFPGVSAEGSSGAHKMGGEPIAKSAAAASSRAAMQQTAGPSNPSATTSVFMACVDSLCCLGSMISMAGCMGLIINLMAIGSGVVGVLNARRSGVGMVPSLIGIALGSFNFLMSILLLIAGALASI